MSNPPDYLDVARLLFHKPAWERRFREYEMLLTAGIDADEAERIVSQAEADRSKPRQFEAA